jgi:hypothetical protein
MYHEAFEMDSDMQKWDSGCWIRYKMFEDRLKDAPSVPAVPLDKLCEWLERNAAGRWNGLEYTAAGWKDELTRRMEEQDAKEEI